MLTFAIRQIVVYVLIFIFSLLVGRFAGPEAYSTFTLFNFFFGLTYIVADFGYGKELIRRGLINRPPHLLTAILLNASLGCTIGGMILFSSANLLGASTISILGGLFFGCTSLAFLWFFKSESQGDFVAIGKAEISQVVVYFITFICIFIWSENAIMAIYIAVAARCLSIPASYWVFCSRSLNYTKRDLIYGTPQQAVSLLGNGMFHQASLVLFALKDLILAYVIFRHVPDSLRGIGFMAQTYMMLPLMVVNPISRVLLPKLARNSELGNVQAIKRLSIVMLLYATVTTIILIIFFPTFDQLLLKGKFTLAGSLLLFFACANIFSIPAIGIASFLAVSRGYKTYLCYALLCTAATWCVGVLGLRLPTDSYGYPSAVLAGHAINAGLVIWFFVSKTRQKVNRAQNI